MNNSRRLLGNQTGFVLAGSLVILAALAVAGVAARVMLRNDHRTAANLRFGSQAFYLAASGVEWSKNQALATSGLTPAPAGGTIYFTSGSFAVSFPSTLSTGPLSAQLVVQSVGLLGANTHSLQARLTKYYDLGDSALGLRGNVRAVSFTGTGIAISGVDYNSTSGQPVAGAKGRQALSTDTQSLSDLVGTQSAALPTGSLQSGSSAAAVGPSSHLGSTSVSQLADQLCAAPGAVTQAIPVTGALALANQSWGTLAAPQIRCIDGVSGASAGVTLSGISSGAGMLIVRNADLILSGTLRWDGLIIVTGSEVGLRSLAGSTTTVFGSILVNETGNPSPSAAALEVNGSFRASFSRSGLNAAATLIPSSQLTGLYASLPASIKQDYWRSVTP